MLIELDMSSEVPIYLQLRNSIVLGIAYGKLQPGESLPTVRQMAQDTGINVMTVSKTYTLLKNDGFIEIDRRHGATVSVSISKSDDYENRIAKEFELIIAEAKINGLDKKQIIEICENLYDKMSNS